MSRSRPRTIAAAVGRAAVAAVDARLRAAYGGARRPHSEPVAELVGTILSQATTDVQTARSFARLRARFPRWEQLRDAPVRAIAREICASGLAAQKAPRIKRALQQITQERGELRLDFLARLPTADALAWLRRLDGVGAKTAAIVMLFALGKPVFPVDTHVQRVTQRLGWIDARMSAERAHAALLPMIPPGAHYRLHINLIRHGRTVCKALRPRCGECVLQDVCAHYAGQVYDAPRARSRA